MNPNLLWNQWESFSVRVALMSFFKSINSQRIKEKKFMNYNFFIKHINLYSLSIY